MKKGFTLVEILVVISVLSIVGVIILTIFTRTLKGNNKAQILAAIKQNGQAVLENMDKTIRGADNVVCPTITLPSPKTLVIVKGGIYTRYRFIEPVCSGDTCTVNGLIKKDSPFKQSVGGVNGEETDGELANRVCSLSDFMDQSTNVTVITDTNPQTGVSVMNGSFTRDNSAGFRDQVTIKFDLNHGVNAPQSVAGQIDPVNFVTTIQLR